MSLQSLTNGQTITIDDHKRGCREHKDWNNPSADIHLHKSTNDTNDPKAVSIRIPLNNPERPVYIENTHRHQKREEVPTWLRKEIEKTLNNKKLREKFGVNFVLSVSLDEDELPASLKEKVIVSL